MARCTYLFVAVMNETRGPDEEQNPVDKVRDETAVGHGWNIARDGDTSWL